MLDAHAAALAACRRCTFDDANVLPVISSAREPRAMLVGQAPGKTEVVDRRPFAGRAGRTLFRWFASIGIDVGPSTAGIVSARKVGSSVSAGENAASVSF